MSSLALWDGRPTTSGFVSMLSPSGTGLTIVTVYGPAMPVVDRFTVLSQLVENAFEQAGAWVTAPASPVFVRK